MRGFAVKLDENLGRSHLDLLHEAGYEAGRVHEEGLTGSEDETLWQYVCAEGRFLITLDLDFSDVRRFPPGSHPGLLLLRPRNRSRDAAHTVLGRVLKHHHLHSLAGCLAVADEHRTRIRRPSSDEDEGL